MYTCSIINWKKQIHTWKWAQYVTQKHFGKKMLFTSWLDTANTMIQIIQNLNNVIHTILLSNFLKDMSETDQSWENQNIEEVSGPTGLFKQGLLQYTTSTTWWCHRLRCEETCFTPSLEEVRLETELARYCCHTVEIDWHGLRVLTDTNSVSHIHTITASPFSSWPFLPITATVKQEL